MSGNENLNMVSLILFHALLMILFSFKASTFDIVLSTFVTLVHFLYFEKIKIQLFYSLCYCWLVLLRVKNNCCSDLGGRLSQCQSDYTTCSIFILSSHTSIWIKDQGSQFRVHLNIDSRGFQNHGISTTQDKSLTITSCKQIKCTCVYYKCTKFYSEYHVFEIGHQMLPNYLDMPRRVSLWAEFVLLRVNIVTSKTLSNINLNNTLLQVKHCLILI